MSIAATALAFLLASATAWAAPDPTYRDVRYSKKYDRSVLDFWKAKSSKPAPLIIYFHGGGFKAGDKRYFYRSKLLSRYLSRGISFATVNYPFTKDATYQEILKHCEVAIAFLLAKQREWNVDPKRIAVAGTSAGCLIAEHVTYSTKAISACYGILQPIGSELILRKIRRGGAPLILYTRSGPGDRIHHPDNARKVKARCDSVGVTCEMWGSKQSGLPQLPSGTSIEDQVMKLFLETWKIRLPGK